MMDAESITHEGMRMNQPDPQETVVTNDAQPVADTQPVLNENGSAVQADDPNYAKYADTNTTGPADDDEDE